LGHYDYVREHLYGSIELHGFGYRSNIDNPRR
jgi:hypothetical protein